MWEGGRRWSEPPESVLLAGSQLFGDLNESGLVMRWDAYTALAFCSGAILFVSSLLPGARMRRWRMYAIAVGIMSMGYALYSATRPIGVPDPFPAWVFVIPLAGALWLLGRAIAWSIANDLRYALREARAGGDVPSDAASHQGGAEACLTTSPRPPASRQLR